MSGDWYGSRGIGGINRRDIPAGVTIQAGASFTEVFGLDDYV